MALLVNFSITVYASEYIRRQNPCEGPCSNVLVAASVCSNVACLCPTLVPSGAGCSACLSENGDITGAVAISSYLATDCLCSLECDSVSSAIAVCSTTAQCLCPTLTLAGPPCISCLATLGFATDASGISSVLYTDCPIAQSASVCSNECGSITQAISSCSSRGQCLCPTLSVIGPPCISCLSALGLVTDASTISSYLATVCNLIPSVEVCSVECGSVANVISICSPNDRCLCPTLSVVGPPCISCISSLGDTTEAATLSSFIATDCQIALTPAPKPPVAPSTATSTVLATSTTVTTSTSQVAKSGAQGVQNSVGLGYFTTIWFLSILAGSLSIFI